MAHSSINLLYDTLICGLFSYKLVQSGNLDLGKRMKTVVHNLLALTLRWLSFPWNEHRPMFCGSTSSPGNIKSCVSKCLWHDLEYIYLIADHPFWCYCVCDLCRTFLLTTICVVVFTAMAGGIYLISQSNFCIKPWKSIIQLRDLIYDFLIPHLFLAPNSVNLASDFNRDSHIPPTKSKLLEIYQLRDDIQIPRGSHQSGLYPIFLYAIWLLSLMRPIYLPQGWMNKKMMSSKNYFDSVVSTFSNKTGEKPPQWSCNEHVFSCFQARAAEDHELTKSGEGQNAE